MKTPTFLKDATADQQKAFHSLCDLFAAGFKDLTSRHTAGQLIGEIVPHADRAETYGDSRMMELAAGLLSSAPKEDATAEQIRTQLYHFRDFAESYSSPADLKRISTLSWTHARSLMAVTDPSARRHLEKQCSSEGWSSRQLQDAIHAARQTIEPGRFAFRDAKTALEGLPAACDNYQQDLERRLGMVTNNLEHLEPDAISDTVAPLLKDAIKALSDLASKVGRIQSRLEKIAAKKQR